MDENRFKLNIELSVEDEEIASEILDKAKKEGVISWQELVSMYRGKGVSIYRIRKIILFLINNKNLVELPCRLFTTRDFLENTEKTKLVKTIVEKVSSMRLRKCGKPIGSPYNKVSVSISREGRVTVVVS